MEALTIASFAAFTMTDGTGRINDALLCKSVPFPSSRVYQTFAR